MCAANVQPDPEQGHAFSGGLTPQDLKVSSSSVATCVEGPLATAPLADALPPTAAAAASWAAQASAAACTTMARQVASSRCSASETTLSRINA